MLGRVAVEITLLILIIYVISPFYQADVTQDDSLTFIMYYVTM